MQFSCSINSFPFYLPGTHNHSYRIGWRRAFPVFFQSYQNKCLSESPDIYRTGTAKSRDLSLSQWSLVVWTTSIHLRGTRTCLLDLKSVAICRNHSQLAFEISLRGLSWISALVEEDKLINIFLKNISTRNRCKWTITITILKNVYIYIYVTIVSLNLAPGNLG